MNTSDSLPDGTADGDVVVEIADAESRLPELVRRAEAGERVIIARGARAAVELRPVSVRRSPIGLYEELCGPVDMAALHAALDTDRSPDELDDFAVDMDGELHRP